MNQDNQELCIRIKTGTRREKTQHGEGTTQPETERNTGHKTQAGQ